MAVVNVHRRRLVASLEHAEPLIDGLAGEEDRLWPTSRWPRMRFDRSLGAGAEGGHGPIRYTVTHYQPGRWVRFRFSRPPGFDGFHEYTVDRDDTGTGVLITHLLAMHPRKAARLTWPLVYRPLHNALIEDSLDRAASAMGQAVAENRWNPRVRALRWLLARRAGRY